MQMHRVKQHLQGKDNKMSQLFFVGIALMLIFEGILPFLSPRFWRRMMQQMIIQPDKNLRVFGLVSMLFGLALLYLIH